MRSSRLVVAGLLAASLISIVPRDAEAIPAFARKYRVTCSLCHSTIPRLTPFGEEFAGNGFEMAVRELARDTIDTGDPLLRLMERIEIAIRMDLFATASAPIRNDATDVDLKTPYTAKLLSGGVLADGISYYMYFLLSERGEVGGLEDAYVQFTDIGRSGISAIVGQFQVSDPLFKRELRLQYEDYQPYRVRVGDARADLAYDRGVLLTYSPWEGGDVALMVVNGQGLNAAETDRQYDSDNAKSFGARYSQQFGPVRIGGFGYFGREHAEGETDRITVLGPDATIGIGLLEINAQYLWRRDTNPLLLPVESESTVHSAMAEVIWGPFGSDGRWTVAGLYNWIDGDAPIISVSAGEEEPLERYHTANAGLHYLLWRNVRLMGEAGYDIERERTRFTLGTVLAF
jgi:hypothetical protein